MFRALLIDDEQHCLDRLSGLLETHCRDSIGVCGQSASVEEACRAIASLHPDLVFLDVQIQDQTGFDLLGMVPRIDFEVIFTTAYEKYAVQAFRFSAMDYLLKPVDPDDLVQAVGKLKEKIGAAELSGHLKALFHNLTQLRGAARIISVPTVKGFTFVTVGEILRCQAQGNYTILFLKDQRKFTVARTLKQFEELLSDYSFFRVHQSHLINLSYIRKYDKGGGGTVWMQDQTQIEVSTRRKEEFLRRVAEI
ncbi:MAG TPA: LytTR family DNA-binding domain-containing protein [Chitinophagaceae bacterium]|nr:LytTR family DNA-binding domain-containing protein [Chitinophagaceae bacterium]